MTETLDELYLVCSAENKALQITNAALISQYEKLCVLFVNLNIAHLELGGEEPRLRKQYKGRRANYNTNNRNTANPFMGVSLLKGRNKWIARLKGEYLGTFNTAELARDARRAKCGILNTSEVAPLDWTEISSL